MLPLFVTFYLVTTRAWSEPSVGEIKLFHTKRAIAVFIVCEHDRWMRCTKLNCYWPNVQIFCLNDVEWIKSDYYQNGVWSVLLFSLVLAYVEWVNATKVVRCSLSARFLKGVWDWNETSPYKLAWQFKFLSVITCRPVLMKLFTD